MKDITTVSLEAVHTHTQYNLSEKIKYKNSNKSLFLKKQALVTIFCVLEISFLYISFIAI